MKVLPIVKLYTTLEQQAEFLFNMRFSGVDYTDFENFYEECNFILPDDEYLFFGEFANDRLDIVDELNEFNEENESSYNDEDEEFREWIMDKMEDEFYDWKSENYSEIMWNTIWKCNDGNWLDDLVNELDGIGIGLVEYKDTTYMYINGCGYNFYDAHWIPLFRDVLKVIKVVDDETYNDEVITINERIQRYLK